MYDSIIYAITTTINEKSKYKCAEVSKDIYQEFEKLDVDLEIKRLFQWHWFNEDADVGPYIFSSVNILKKENENKRLENGIIQIGDCPNGDEIFLRLGDTAVLYWSHDVAEGKRFEQRDSEALFVAYKKIEYLLINICNGNFIPWDSYSAQDYFELYNGK